MSEYSVSSCIASMVILIFFLSVFAIIIDEGYKNREDITIKERLGTAQHYLDNENNPSRALEVYEKLIERYGPIPEAVEEKEEILQKLQTFLDS